MYTKTVLAISDYSFLLKRPIAKIFLTINQKSRLRNICNAGVQVYVTRFINLFIVTYAEISVISHHRSQWELIIIIYSFIYY